MPAFSKNDLLQQNLIKVIVGPKMLAVVIRSMSKVMTGKLNGLECANYSKFVLALLDG